MRADVAEAAGRPRLARIGAPRSLLLAPRFEPRSQPSLNIIRSQGLNLAELARENHLPRMANKRVSGVVVGERENASRALDDLVQFLGLFQIEGHGRVADDVAARFYRRVGN